MCRIENILHFPPILKSSNLPIYYTPFPSTSLQSSTLLQIILYSIDILSKGKLKIFIQRAKSFGHWSSADNGNDKYKKKVAKLPSTARVH